MHIISVLDVPPPPAFSINLILKLQYGFQVHWIWHLEAQKKKGGIKLCEVQRPFVPLDIDFLKSDHSQEPGRSNWTDNRQVWVINNGIGLDILDDLI